MPDGAVRGLTYLSRSNKTVQFHRLVHHAAAIRHAARSAALLAIRLYQRHLSPRKGYGCAYRLHTGRASCSSCGHRAISRHGLRTGLRLILRRTARCSQVNRQHRQHLALPRRPNAAQRGDCDLGCDLPCDPCEPGGRGLSRACDFLSCCDCYTGDWPNRNKKQPRKSRS